MPQHRIIGIAIVGSDLSILNRFLLRIQNLYVVPTTAAVYLVTFTKRLAPRRLHEDVQPTSGRARKESGDANSLGTSSAPAGPESTSAY